MATQVKSLKATTYQRRRDFELSMGLHLQECAKYEKDKWLHLYYASLAKVARCQKELHLYREVVQSFLRLIAVAAQWTGNTRLEPTPNLVQHELVQVSPAPPHPTLIPPHTTSGK